MRISATDAARNFSDLLNRVASGEEVEVMRNGAPVAMISPPRDRLMSAAKFREVIASAPRPDTDFATAVRAVRAASAPPEEPWPS